MTIWVYEHYRVIRAIGIQVQTQRVVGFTPVAVLGDEPAGVGVVVPGPQVVKACFNVEELAGIPYAVTINLYSQHRVAEDVILIVVLYIALDVHGLDYVSMPVVQVEPFCICVVKVRYVVYSSRVPCLEVSFPVSLQYHMLPVIQVVRDLKGIAVVGTL